MKYTFQASKIVINDVLCCCYVTHLINNKETTETTYILGTMRGLLAVISA
jgi:hypothetical protein